VEGEKRHCKECHKTVDARTLVRGENLPPLD